MLRRLCLKKYIIYKIFYNGFCAYLGRTKQPINNRLRGHFFSKPMHKTIDIRLVTKIEIAECNSEADMFLYEIYYINKFKPPLNRDDKAVDSLTISIPELEFKEYQTLLINKWLKQKM